MKSWITAPLDGARAGQVQATGVAFGGMEAVARVEVSADGGQTWGDARLVGPDLGRFAWRTFVLPLTLAPGRHMLVSRATDARGAVQPEDTAVNGSGYSHNGWRAPGVELVVA